MEDLQFELIENGLDFIASGLNYIVSWIGLCASGSSSRISCHRFEIGFSFVRSVVTFDSRTQTAKLRGGLGYHLQGWKADAWLIQPLQALASEFS